MSDIHNTIRIRTETRQIRIGNVAVGGGAPVSVQTMTKTDTADVDSTVAQIREVAALGCDLVRLAVPDEQAAAAIGSICKQSPIPVIADIHFDYRLALKVLAGGVHGLRINPGNIGGNDKVREVVRAAAERKVPIRIGVNAGSLEKDVLSLYGGATAEALVESALRHVRLLEDAGYYDIKISVKASDVARTIEAYRVLAASTPYPLHVGVTEAGTFLAGTVRSSVAMGMLLSEGIGDTIRVSLTDQPHQEVRVGLEILRCLGLRAPGPHVTSCPTCGRIEIDVISLARAVEDELEKFFAEHPDRPCPHVAVMGCMVNGPGEARAADIAIAGGKGKAALYIHGQMVSTIPEDRIVEAIMDEVRKWHPLKK